MDDLAAIRAIERAEQAVDDLCHGRLTWTMRVPAEPDHDPDLIISRALREAREYIDAAEAREATLREAFDGLLPYLRDNPGCSRLMPQDSGVCSCGRDQAVAAVVAALGQSHE